MLRRLALAIVLWLLCTFSLEEKSNQQILSADDVLGTQLGIVSLKNTWFTGVFDLRWLPGGRSG